MPTLEYFLVCRSVQEDKHTNEVSFINVLEDITPGTFPHVIPIAVAVSLWNVQQGENTVDCHATLIVRIPGKADAPFLMNFSPGTRRCRAIHGILDIPIEHPGEITFELQLNGRHQASHTIIVHPVGVRNEKIGVALPA
jgi:hypothetical protein